MSTNYIAEIQLNFDDYDEKTLSIKCPECNAAASGKCLEPKSGGMGGRLWLPAPHRSRLLAAHGREVEDIWGKVTPV